MPIDIGDHDPKRRACFATHYIFDTALRCSFAMVHAASESLRIRCSFHRPGTHDCRKHT